ncbi:MAG TPA: glycosyltransferase family 4 protein [Gaiellaceae bacterium]|nr:glycosyltransferase family 4 protein [Gaiellaceae bacterium]
MVTPQRPDQSRRVTLVADEILGYVRTGGLGTATSFLAVALGRMGHSVELLYVGERPPEPMGSDWARLYQSAGVAIRILPRSDTRVEPSYFARMRDTELALRGDPPDVVITQDLAAPAYTALRMRRLGLGFEDTLFVVYCHGSRRWITDMAQKVRVLPGALAVSLLEQASVELADVVVSPSSYLLQWMQHEGWQLPSRSLVIPYLTRAAATGEAAPSAAELGRRVERITFFGRLEERKGLRPFVAAVNAVEPELLRRVELEFLGAATPAWPPERIEAMFSKTAKAALRGISFQTRLDQPGALARLSRPGTLAVMPSMAETFSNAVYECLERGIPFISSDAGAPPELIAESDRPRVLFEPTRDGIAAALRRELADGSSPRPVRRAFDPADSFETWREVLATEPRAPERTTEPLTVEVVRQGSFGETTAEWIVLLGPEDVPSQELVETLMRAQVASGADVVTCGVRIGHVQRFFLGDPGGLGLLSNSYGTVALIRRSLLSDKTWSEPMWPLLARLGDEGAQIISIPQALVEQTSPPADVERDPSEALRVLEQVERQLPQQLRSLARLAAGLVADATAARASAPVRRRLFRPVWRR